MVTWIFTAFGWIQFSCFQVTGEMKNELEGAKENIHNTFFGEGEVIHRMPKKVFSPMLCLYNSL